MSILAVFFEILVTPAGTTTLEVIAWLAIFSILVYRRRSHDEGSKGGGGGAKVVQGQTKSLTDSHVNGAAKSLRRRTLTTSLSDRVISSTSSVPSEDPGSQASDAAGPQTRKSFQVYGQLLIIAYIIDAAFFLLISLFMHNSILFIPTPCENSTATTACNYSFHFDREMYWDNPATNDSIHVIFIGGKGTNGAKEKRPILYTHGNSFNVAHPKFLKLYEALTEVGFDVYAWDYPGYGKSRVDPSNKMSLARFEEDAKFVLHKVSWLSSRDPENVILWGFSMGAAISTALAVQHPVKSLVLQFPPDRFDWIVREGTKLTGWLSALPQYKVLDVFSLIVDVKSPTRVLHLAAEFDHYVTHARQERLFRQLPPYVQAQSRFITVRGVGHDACPFDDKSVLPLVESLLTAV